MLEFKFRKRGTQSRPGNCFLPAILAPRYWGLFRNWTGPPLTNAEIPNEWLYRGMDELAGQVCVALKQGLLTLYACDSAR